MNRVHASPKHERTSALLRRLIDELPDDEVEIDHILRQLHRRSFGGVFVSLAAFGLLPGLSFLAGLAMIVPAVQLAIGLDAPVLPRFVRKRRIDAATLRALGDRTTPWIESLERFVRPRWRYLTVPPIPMLAGLVMLGLALAVMLPLPLSNLPPAIAIFCLSLGLLERDGLILGIGLLLAAAALALGVVMAFVAFEAVSPVIRGYLE